jgi:hemolytic enterotoxin HBL
MPTRFFPFTLSADMLATAGIIRPRGAEPLTTDTTPIDQQLADSFNANNYVLAYVVAVTGTDLPALSPQPSWYQSFLAQFADAKTHALEWQNSVTPGLIAIPTSILNYAPIWSMNTATINQAVAILRQDPSNQQAQAAVRASLQTLSQGTSAQLSAATAFQQTIDTFSTDLTTDAATMQAAIQNAQQQQGYDQDQVNQLVADVNSLTSQIATWQVVATASGIGAGVAFFAGCVIAIFSFGAGLAFGIVGAAAGIATLIAADVEIQKLSLQVAKDQVQMSDLNQQIATLTVIEQNLQELITLSQQASQQVQLILDTWSTLEQEITAVITDLDDAQGDLSSMDLPQLAADMTDANADWATLQQFCTVIAGIQYNTATPPSADLPTDPTTARAAASTMAAGRR